MASTFEVAVQTVAASAGAPYCMIQNSAPANGPVLHIVEVGFTLNAGTFSKIGLVRALTLGTPSGTASPGQAKAAYDVTTPWGSVVTTWSAAPTIAATPYYFRQIAAAAVAGSGTVWPDQSDPWEVPPGGALLLWNFDISLAGSIASAYWKWRE